MSGAVGIVVAALRFAEKYGTPDMEAQEYGEMANQFESGATLIVSRDYMQELFKYSKEDRPHAARKIFDIILNPAKGD